MHAKRCFVFTSGSSAFVNFINCYNCMLSYNWIMLRSIFETNVLAFKMIWNLRVKLIAVQAFSDNVQ